MKTSLSMILCFQKKSVHFIKIPHFTLELRSGVDGIAKVSCTCHPQKKAHHLTKARLDNVETLERIATYHLRLSPKQCTLLTGP